MNGALSAAPGQGAIRLLLGSHGLLCTQSALTAWSGLVHGSIRTLSIVVLAIAIVALTGALVGDTRADHDQPWKLRHGR